MKNGFVLYTDYIEQVEMLEAEQAKALFLAVLKYASGEELPEMDLPTRLAFSFIRKQIDRENEKYQKTVEARKEAGAKGGRPKKQTEQEEAKGFSKKQEKAKKANGFSEKQIKAEESKKSLHDQEQVQEQDIKEKSSDEDKKKNPAESMPADVFPLSCFEDFWRSYPASDNLPVTAKQRTETVYAIAFTEGFPESDLIAAAKNYAEAVRIEERDARYIKRPENFLSDGTYKDYLPDVYVKPEAIRKKQTAADRYNAGIMQRDVDLEALERELLGKGG